MLSGSVLVFAVLGISGLWTVVRNHRIERVSRGGAWDAAPALGRSGDEKPKLVTTQRPAA